MVSLSLCFLFSLFFPCTHLFVVMCSFFFFLFFFFFFCFVLRSFYFSLFLTFGEAPPHSLLFSFFFLFVLFGFQSGKGSAIEDKQVQPLHRFVHFLPFFCQFPWRAMTVGGALKNGSSTR